MKTFCASDRNMQQGILFELKIPKALLEKYLILLDVLEHVYYFFDTELGILQL